MPFGHLHPFHPSSNPLLWQHPIGNVMDLQTTIPIEEIQTEKEKYYMIYLICIILKEMIQMNFITNRKTYSLREQIYGWCWGSVWDRDSQGIWDGYTHTHTHTHTHTLLYLKWISNKDVLYNTGNSA